MKKLIAIAAVVAFGLGVASTSMAGKSPPVNTDDVKAHKVLICHFPGHDGDFEIGGAGFACVNADGEILEVSKKGAGKGHGVE